MQPTNRPGQQHSPDPCQSPYSQYLKGFTPRQQSMFLARLAQRQQENPLVGFPLMQRCRGLRGTLLAGRWGDSAFGHRLHGYLGGNANKKRLEGLQGLQGLVTGVVMGLSIGIAGPVFAWHDGTAPHGYQVPVLVTPPARYLVLPNRTMVTVVPVPGADTRDLRDTIRELDGTLRHAPTYPGSQPPQPPNPYRTR